MRSFIYCLSAILLSSIVLGSSLQQQQEVIEKQDEIEKQVVETEEREEVIEPEEELECPSGWTEHKIKKDEKNEVKESLTCLHVNNTLMTRAESTAYCEKVAHRLVTIMSRDKSKTVYPLMSRNKPYWLGLEWDHEAEKHYWLTPNDTVRALKSDDHPYMPWGPFEPLADRCRSIFVYNSLWYQYPCLVQEEYRAYTVCEYFHVVPDTGGVLGLTNYFLHLLLFAICSIVL